MSLILVPVTIVADVACPWSMVGYHLLRDAFSQMNHKFTPVITWEPFSVNQGVKSGGERLNKYLLKRRGISAQECSANLAKLREACASLKLSFTLSDERLIYNSAKANKLMLWLKNTHHQEALFALVTQSYFEKDLPIDDDGVLLSLVSELGLNVHEARSVITDKEYEKQLGMASQHWIDQGLIETPLFVIGEEFMLSGAQKKSCFFSVLQEMSKKNNQNLTAA